MIVKGQISTNTTADQHGDQNTKNLSKMNKTHSFIPRKMKVYFICLVASSLEGLPEKEHYLYDVASEVDLQEFDVEFMSAQDLQAFYEVHSNASDRMSTYKSDDYIFGDKIYIYELALFFVKRNKESSFFVDEVPFIGKTDGSYSKY